jgi:hypothetical protein
MVEQFAGMLGEAAPPWEQISMPAPVLKLA